MTTLAAYLHTGGALSLLFILLALGCFVAAAVAAWRGVWVVALILLAVGVVVLAASP